MLGIIQNCVDKKNKTNKHRGYLGLSISALQRSVIFLSGYDVTVPHLTEAEEQLFFGCRQVQCRTTIGFNCALDFLVSSCGGGGGMQGTF